MVYPIIIVFHFIVTNKTTNRKYAGQSEAERVQERKERFLAAGLQLFGTLGLKGTKVKPLCKEAGLTERYFYESFANVEALFLDVYNHQNQRIQTLFMEELPKLPKDIDERTYAALDIYYSLMRDERLVRVLLLDCMVGSDEIKNMHQENTQQLGKLASQFIRIDNPNISLSDDILEHTALAINGAVKTLAMQWMLEGYQTPQETIVYSASLAVKGVMAEIRKH